MVPKRCECLFRKNKSSRFPFKPTGGGNTHSWLYNPWYAFVAARLKMTRTENQTKKKKPAGGHLDQFSLGGTPCHVGDMNQAENGRRNPTGSPEFSAALGVPGGLSGGDSLTLRNPSNPKEPQGTVRNPRALNYPPFLGPPVESLEKGIPFFFCSLF